MGYLKKIIIIICNYLQAENLKLQIYAKMLILKPFLFQWAMSGCTGLDIGDQYRPQSLGCACKYLQDYEKMAFSE